MPRDRNAMLFIGVSLSAGFGGNALSVVSGVWALDLTRSSSLAALVGLCAYVPSLFGPILGGIVDRLPHRPLLIATDLVTAAVVLSLLALRSPQQLWLLYAVMLGYGVGRVLLAAGESALLAAAVSPDALGGLNGVRMSAQEGMKLVAPLAGAALFTWIGGASVAALTAVTLAVSAALYGLVRPTTRYPAKKNQLRQGLRYLWRHTTMRTLVVVAGVCVAISGFNTAAFYTVITADLHRPAAFAGVLASAQGAGSIIGGLVAGKVRDSVVLSAAGAALVAVGVAGRLVPITAVVIASGVVTGIGLPWPVIAAMTVVQRETDSALLGTVAGTAGSAMFAPVALAIPAGAGLSSVVGHRLSMLLCVAVALLMSGHAARARSCYRPG